MGLFSRLTVAEIAPAPGQTVVRAADYQCYIDAQALIDSARQQAEQILTDAKQAYAASRERGYQDGLEQGKLEMAEQMIANLSGAVDYFASIEQKVGQLVMRAVRKVLGEFDDTELTTQVVRNALNAVRNQKQITLRVAPEQVEPIKEKVHELLAGYQSINFIDVSGDRRLPPGGCILETEIGVVDASVEVQLAALQRSLDKRLGAS